MPDQCPECEIIIISYAEIPSIASAVQWKCESIEALYGTSFVQARVKARPELHKDVMNKLANILRRQKNDAETLDGIIKSLTE